MLVKLLPLLFTLGLADRIIGPGSQNTFDDQPVEEATPTNGTLLTASIIEGNGCPAGTFYMQPIEPGKVMNTFVEFDNWVYNSTTSPEPVTCGVKFTFEFVYPESGLAALEFGTKLFYTSAFEEGDTEQNAQFVAWWDISATAGPNAIGAPWGIIDTIARTTTAQIGAGLGPEGTPGEVASGSFEANITLSTEYGPGQFSGSRIDFGFGVLL